MSADDLQWHALTIGVTGGIRVVCTCHGGQYPSNDLQSSKEKLTHVVNAECVGVLTGYLVLEARK